ncbi:hypothetical protein CTAYLR_005101 [Chrysophaeum taylorii]|uniref:SSD domain-containing protein n=1 Tax=Chrysophaeum taylorii TaxID=2483200 RepID=A0AAD7UGJ3_9STRA|nr:hypothetical protein CTAYLR_005101 [Chrysophaeum taylorii]
MEEERPAMKRGGSAYSSVVHGDRQRKQEGEDAWFAFKFAVTYRRTSCCCLGLLNLCWLILTLALAYGGYSPINDANLGEVGLYILDGEYQQRANAYETAKDEADASLNPGKCQREDPADPIELTIMKGRFQKKNRGNALSKSGLEKLRSRENKITNEAGWEHRCALVYVEGYGRCEVDQGTEYDVLAGSGTWQAADERGCMRPFSPVYFFEKYGDANFEDIPGTVAAIQTSTTDWLSFTDMLHKDFTTSNLRSKILKSSIYAGTPRRDLTTYASTEDKERINEGFSISFYDTTREERERKHLGNWIEDNLKNWLDKQVTKTPYRTLYNYPEYDAIQDQVEADLALLAVSLIAVILYMWWYTGSAFITFCGIFQILMSFFGANLLYRYCWPTDDGLGYDFFSIFCALALFIIMGIGADDIFVYWDTWLGSAAHEYPTVAHRMSHVYSHAAVAMLVSVNYLAVITFFPCAVLVYDRYLAHLSYWWADCFGRCEKLMNCAAARCKRKLRGEAAVGDAQPIDDPTKAPLGGGAPAAVEEEVEVAVAAKDDEEENEEEEEEALPRWFRTTYADFVEKRRWLILGALMALWVAFLVFASMLETTPFSLYTLLPETSNFHQWTFIDENWYPKTADPLNVHVLYGLDHRAPLSLNGVRPQNFETLATGDPEWDEGFDLDSTSAQRQLYRTAEEFLYSPRSGLKIDVSNGINTQLAGSSTGSLEQTPDGGTTSTVQTAYGVQSLFHALAQWENASVVANDATAAFEVVDDSESTCKPCFNTFLIDPNPFDLDDGFIDPDTGLTVDSLTLNSTSPLNDLCDCVGFFPVPNVICLHETRSNADETLYKCTESENELATQLGNFLNAGEENYDEKWWEDYIFALADSNGRYTRIAMYDIQVQTVLRASETDISKGLRMAKKWDDWMDDHNSDPNNPLSVMVYVPNAENWYRDSLLAPSGVQNMLLSLFLAWLVLNMATFNYIISSLATITIGLITTIVLGTIHVLGWGLGPLESILIVIVIGFSVDYTVHLADSYMGSKSITRAGKVRDALGHTGSSVLSGAISTLSASIPMFGAQIIFFQKFGAFVFMTIALSLIYSLGFFSALLCVCGPLGTRGHFSNFYGKTVESMHAHVAELAKEQAEVDANEKLLHDTEEKKKEDP